MTRDELLDKLSNNMTKGKLLDKLEEFEFRVNEIISELEDITEECDTLYYDIQMLRRECEEE